MTGELAIVAEGLHRKFGQTVVVENKKGAGGNIGAEAVYTFYAGGAAVDFVKQYAQSEAKDLPLFAAGALATETIRYANIGFAPLAGIVYQGAVIAGLAFTVNFRLIRRYPPSVMMSFNFVAPVAGVLLGASILGEPVTAGLVGGMLLVAAGLVLITRGSRAGIRA